MRVRWTRQARDELVAIVAYVSVERPEAARRLAARIRESVTVASQHPYIGRVVPELDIANLRERIVAPYRVLYQVRGDEIVVLTIFHSRRALPPGPEEDAWTADDTHRRSPRRRPTPAPPRLRYALATHG